MYVDGIRTSAQAAILTAGVAKGADFTGTVWAVALGFGLFLTLESAKILAGWLDARFNVWSSHTQAVAEQNPIVMRQLEALERLSPILPSLQAGSWGQSGVTPPPIGSADCSDRCACPREFTRHQTGCTHGLDTQPIRAVNVMRLR